MIQTLPQTESIQMRIRPHVLVLLPALTAWLLAILVPLGLARLVNTLFDLSWLENQAVVPFIFIYISLVSVWGLLKVRQWVTSSSYLTESRLLIVQEGLRQRFVWSVDFGRIDSVTISYASRLSRKFGLGTIKIIAGDQSVSMRQVASADAVAAHLVAMAERAQNSHLPDGFSDTTIVMPPQALIIPAQVNDPLAEAVIVPDDADARFVAETATLNEGEWIAPPPDMLDSMPRAFFAEPELVELNENEVVYF